MVDQTQYMGRGGRPKTYYHLTDENLHRWRSATNCYAYVRTIREWSTGVEADIHTVELKWECVFFPYVAIGPRATSVRPLPEPTTRW